MPIVYYQVTQEVACYKAREPQEALTNPKRGWYLVLPKTARMDQTEVLGVCTAGNFPNWQSSWLRRLIFIIVINLLFYDPLLSRSSSGQSMINLLYTGFLQQVELRNVKDVMLVGPLNKPTKVMRLTPRPSERDPENRPYHEKRRSQHP